MELLYFGDGGIPLVAIHGLGSAKSAWYPMVQALPKNFRLIVFDLPGHGDSKELAQPEMTPEVLAEIIHANLIANGLTKFHLIGNSLGGWIALEMGAKFPESVLSVTGVSPAGLWLTPRSYLSPALSTSRFMARIFYRYANYLLKFKVLRFIGFGLVSPQWEKLSIETCVDAAVAMGTASGYPALWKGTNGNRFDKKISENIPVSIIFGDTDNTLPAKDCQEKSLVPKHSNWYVLKKSGHAPMWDQTESVIEILRETTGGDFPTR